MTTSDEIQWFAIQTRLDDGRIIITKAGAELVGPEIKYRAFGTLHVQFVSDGKKATGARVFELDVTELDAKGTRLGGQRLLPQDACEVQDARNRHPTRDFRWRDMDAEGRVLLLNY